MTARICVQRLQTAMNYPPSAASNKNRGHPTEKKLIIALCTLLFFAVSSTFFSALILERQWLDDGSRKPPSYFKKESWKRSEKTSSVILGGMILDGSKIHSQVWSTIMTLNCEHDVSVHFLVEKGFKEAGQEQERIRTQRYQNNVCAPFLMEGQESIQTELERITNRIDRISVLRDFHRLQLKNMLEARANTSSNDPSKDIVILVDLDLFRLPSVKDLVSQIKQLQEPKETYPHDAICAAGVTMAKTKNVGRQQEPWYYDTFATVLLPDTYTHPLKRRLYKQYYNGEDPNFVRSDNRFGKFTQGDLFRHLVEKANESPTGAAGVRSCYGGIAMYRAPAYLDLQCRYRLTKNDLQSDESKSKSIMRYASEKEERPCEHVVFHDCLLKSFPKFDLAVNPSLVTFWKRL